MRRRRRKLRDENVPAFVREHLGLGHVGKGIEVEPVPGGAVRLVAGQIPVRPAPASAGEEFRQAPEELAWGLAFPEATRAGP